MLYHKFKSAKRKRFFFYASIIFGLGLSLYLFLFAMQDDIVFFYSPSDLTQDLKERKKIRLGGLVREGSLTQSAIENQSPQYEFVITDLQTDITVMYQGLLPNLFKEGKGAVVEGYFIPEDSVFKAHQVLAKHDENYMPREVRLQTENQAQISQEQENFVGQFKQIHQNLRK